MYGGPVGSWVVSVVFDCTAVETIDLGSCGWGGVGPLIGTKRVIAVRVVVDCKHTARNVDEGDSGMPVDWTSTEGDFSISTEGTVTVGAVAGVM